MKVLVGSFQCESNTFAKKYVLKENFELLYGDSAAKKLWATKVFSENGISIVPMPYAVALPGGMVKKEAYLEILADFIKTASENTDADGVYMYVHGAMYVEGIGSGEEYFVREIRKVLGKDIPISVTCDFHANLSDKYLEGINALSGFRTAPHTDYNETEERAAKALIKILNNKLNTRVMRIKLPMLLADAAVTARDPYKTAISMLKELDGMENVVAASVFNGQPWVDAEYVGVSVTASYYENAEPVNTVCKKIADELWNRRNEFSFGVKTLSPDITVTYISGLKKPVFISDSGDNTTAGAEGKSTFLLEKFLHSDIKGALFASIYDSTAVEKTSKLPTGSRILLDINGLLVNAVIKGRGIILGFKNEIAGRGVLISCGDTDIILSDVRTSFITPQHFEAMGIKPSSYNYIILKMGYLWPLVEPLCKSFVFSLTPGTSTNAFELSNYNCLRGDYFTITGEHQK